MTNEELDALETLRAKATPGPWADSGASFDNWHDHTFEMEFIDNTGGENPRLREDVALIVAACNALPRLIARGRELEAEAAAFAEIREAVGMVYEDGTPYPPHEVAEVVGAIAAADPDAQVECDELRDRIRELEAGRLKPETVEAAHVAMRRELSECTNLSLDKSAERMSDALSDLDRAYPEVPRG